MCQAKLMFLNVIDGLGAISPFSTTAGRNLIEFPAWIESATAVRRADHALIWESCALGPLIRRHGQPVTSERPRDRGQLPRFVEFAATAAVNTMYDWTSSGIGPTNWAPGTDRMFGDHG